MNEHEALTVSQLSEVTRISVASIKFYLREGLLAAGDMTKPHRAYYSQLHIDRLRLIVALRDVGGLSIGTIREVVQTLDSGKTPTFRLISRTLNAVTANEASPLKGFASADLKPAMRELNRFLTDRGIRVQRSSAALHELARALTAIRATYPKDVSIDRLVPYVEAAEQIARHETNAGTLTGEPQFALRAAVLGTLLWERILIYLRRVLHEHLAAEVYDQNKPP